MPKSRILVSNGWEFFELFNETRCQVKAGGKPINLTLTSVLICEIDRGFAFQT